METSFLTSESDARYVAPEYANSGMLNEKSDIYSFGVVLLECVTARDPVDYAKPADEVRVFSISDYHTDCVSK